MYNNTGASIAKFATKLVALRNQARKKTRKKHATKVTYNAVVRHYINTLEGSVLLRWRGQEACLLSSCQALAQSQNGRKGGKKVLENGTYPNF